MSDENKITIIQLIMLVILACVLVILFNACSAPVLTTYDKTYSIKETITKEYRDSIVAIPLPDESAEITTGDTSSTLQTSLAISYAAIIGDKLTHKITNKKSFLYNIRFPFVSVTTQQDQILTKTIIKEVEKELNWLQKTLIGVGVVFLIIITLKIILYMLKRRLPF